MLGNRKSIYLRGAKIPIVKGREYLRSPYNYKTLQINFYSKEGGSGPKLNFIVRSPTM